MSGKFGVQMSRYNSLAEKILSAINDLLFLFFSHDY